MNDTAPAVYVIGLCGRSGSGKTTVCKAFEKYGIKSVDTDMVYRELTIPSADGVPSELVQRISDKFGRDVVSADGSLNRRELASAVFGNGSDEKLALLNSITHAPILKRTDELIEKYGAEGAIGVIVDAPALFESGFHKKCRKIVCVSAPDDVLISRIISRDQITPDAAKKRLSSQISDTKLRQRADFVIENDGMNDLEKEADRVFREIFGE